MTQLKLRYKEILVWTAYFLLLFSIAHNNWGSLQNGAEVSLFMVFIHAIIFYGNYYILMPLTFAKKNYWRFVIGSLVFAVFWIGITYLMFRFAFGSGYWMSPETSRMLGPLHYYLNIEELWTARVSLSGLNVFFISILYFYAEQDKLLTQRMWALEHEKIRAEIKLLRMQTNPHFLFNALNNIYAQAVLEGSKVADSIHQLSGLLRYALYDCDEEEVELYKEIEYIDHYIDLQKLKGEALDAVELRVEGNLIGTRIVPMLLISFVENAFKHGDILDGGWIKINISISPQTIVFNCLNSVSSWKKDQDTASGIGLKNVKKRLSLNYPNRHQLSIIKRASEFEIKLSITKNNEPKLSNC